MRYSDTIPHRPCFAIADETGDVGADPVRLRGDERRQAIAKAAREIIAEKGLEGLRTRDIADRVGINIATLHYHVPSKEALITLVAESAIADFIDHDREIEQKGLTPPQRLQHEIDEFIDMLEHRAELWTVISEIAERARRDPEIYKIHARLRSGWVRQVQTIFNAGLADCSLRPDIDPTAAGYLFVSALIGAFKMPVTPAQRRQVLDELMRCFVKL